MLPEIRVRDSHVPPRLTPAAESPMTLAEVQHLSRLSDTRLLEATAALVRRRDTQTALIVAHLAVIAKRQAYRPLGYSSLYRYCVHELHLSEHSA